MKSNLLPTNEETAFSKEQINEQVQKIILDPVFKYSEILKRFLLFIVEQTLEEHTEWIKEYTIGVYVLNKPKDYKPEKTGIVRIHAGRLRRSLHKYYAESGVNDEILISVPNGSYIPVFSKNTVVINAGSYHESAERKINIAVLPFLPSSNKRYDSFCDSLCIDLTNEIMHREKLSVVTYYIMRNLYNKMKDLREVASVVEADYILTGNLQANKDKFRINIEMIEATTYKLVWSTMVAKAWSEANTFQIQDEIIGLTINAVEEYFDISSKEGKIKVIA